MNNHDLTELRRLERARRTGSAINQVEADDLYTRLLYRAGPALLEAAEQNAELRVELEVKEMTLGEQATVLGGAAVEAEQLRAENGRLRGLLELCLPYVQHRDDSDTPEHCDEACELELDIIEALGAKGGE